MGRYLALALAAVFGVVQPNPAISQSVRAEAAARTSLAEFLAAWNRADNEALRKTLNFPHVTLGGDRMLIAGQRSEFRVDFERMREGEGWARSTFDAIEVHRSAPHQVHCEATYSRYRVDGTKYRTGSVLYVVTEKDGHWGMQFRSPLGPSPARGSGEQAEVKHQARQAVLDFFTDFNAASNEALVEHLSFPHAFLLRNGNLVVAEDRQGPGASMDFERMRAREGWHMSSLDSLDAIHVASNMVHFEIVFSRYHRNGLKYRTVPALWIVTRQSEGWGLQFRSLLEPTFAE